MRRLKVSIQLKDVYRRRFQFCVLAVALLVLAAGCGCVRCVLFLRSLRKFTCLRALPASVASRKGLAL